MKRSMILLGAFAALAACSGGSDPASETPVELKPGKYDVRTLGSWMMQSPDLPGRVQVCLGEWQARDFPQHPLEKTARRWSGCSDAIDPPRGNAMSGTRTCPIGVAKFEGEHGEDSFAIRGTVTSRKSPKEEPFTITGRRIGDC